MMQAGMGAAMGAFGAGGAGGKPSVRNPILVLVLPFGLMFGGAILSAILGMIAWFLVFVGTLVTLAGVLLMLVYMIGMLRELGSYTRDPDYSWWWVFIPLLQYYFLWIVVPAQMSKAKQMAGVEAQKPTKGIIFYVFLAPWALASDLNDIAQG